MGRTGVTEKEVFKAADSLAGEGVKVTLKALRERLGTGSPNTIHRHFSTWRDSRPAELDELRSLPIGLVTSIRAELETVAERIRSEFDEDLAQARNEAAVLASAGAGLEDEVAELRDALEARSRACERLEGRCLEQTEAAARLSGALDVARGELEAQRQRADLALEQLNEARDKQSKLEAALEDARVEVQSGRERCVALDAECTAANANLRETKARVADLEARIDARSGRDVPGNDMPKGEADRQREGGKMVGTLHLPKASQIV